MMIIDIEENINVGYSEEIYILKKYKESLNNIFDKMKKENNYNFEKNIALELDNFINNIL
jgi:hypothetical protein